MVSSFGSHPRKPTLEDRVIALMRARSVDHDLSVGPAARIAEAHNARVEHLATARARRAVAHNLDRLIDQGCEQVWQAKPMIRATAARLRSAEPVDARGVARLRTLLADPSGPCYVPSSADALTVALRDIGKSLDVEG